MDVFIDLIIVINLEKYASDDYKQCWVSYSKKVMNYICNQQCN